MTPATATKSDWRRRLLAARRARSPAERAAADSALVTTLMGTVSERAVRTVAAYSPLLTEPGGPALLPTLASVAREILIPVLLPDRDLDWQRWPSIDTPPARTPVGKADPAAGPGGSAVPGGSDQLGGSDLVGSAELLGVTAVGGADLVVVPAVAVDLGGVRLGRGGGSYDRALARVGPGTLVVALLFDGELVESLPAEPHDRRVHAVITPSGGLRHVG
ncbi:5-formyltetrahydrofolate cyclo-ligase [Luedemannella flava]|uniref:5-formyltetrahydrofolate cyclo-ligase n=1 Tax=Luedemannella flava TaxID=349316 RepID=A0ABP4Y084_9ACTN